MFRSARARRDEAWNLRETDLPPEEILAAEPRLRGLEDNAVYRRLRCPGRLRGVAVAGAPGPGCAILYVLIALPQGVLTLRGAPTIGHRFAAGLILLAYGWIVVRALYTRYGEPARISPSGSPSAQLGMSSIGTLTNREVADLLVSGIAPSEIAIGMWGTTLFPRWLRRRRFRAWTLAALGAVGNVALQWWMRVDETSLGKAIALQVLANGILAVGFAALAIARIDRGWIALASVRSGLRQACGFSVDWGIAGATAAATVGGLFVLIALAGAAILLPAVAIGRFLPYDEPTFWLFVSPAVGYGIGYLMADSARSNRDRNFDESVRCVEELMEDAREKLFEKTLR